ncbi:MAG: transposase [Lachnospiraceae bacterium]|nr:transposase [Lachnospiraceae bacterium]
MMKVLKSFKTEIDPTPDQKIQINKTIGTCRFIYNFYISHNKSLYNNGGKFMSGKSFSVWLNNEFIPAHQEKAWIKEVSSKSVKKSIEDGCTAFQNFFKGRSGFPKFKKKGKSDVRMYFVKNNPKDCLCERHRIKIPALGWVKLKEKGYIPTAEDGYKVRSGTISVHAGRYYVSVLIEMPDIEPAVPETEGIGIDLGIKDLAILSDGRIYPNINKTPKMRKLEKQLKRQQRKLSRKYEYAEQHKGIHHKNLKKQVLKVQKLHQRINNIRTDHINKAVAEAVKTKPSYITIEDLDVSCMMKNRHLSKAVASQKLYEYRSKLETKCRWNNIECRFVSRFYPSSKMCHNCGHIKKDLKLSDRIYHCDECGYEADRDFNASLNLKDAEIYSIA